MSAQSMRVAGFEPGDQEGVRLFLEELVSRTKIPGIAVAINMDGKTIKAAAGAHDLHERRALSADALFDPGAINAFLIALVSHDMASRRLLDLQTPVAVYLPELADSVARTLLVEHLISHTAGYQRINLSDPDVVMSYSDADFAASLMERPCAFPPGAVFDPCPSHTELVAKILERVSGRPVHDLLRATIFRPLSVDVAHSIRAAPERGAGRHAFDLRSRRFVQVARVPWNAFWNNTTGAPPVRVSDLAKIGAAVVKHPTIFPPEALMRLTGTRARLAGQFPGRSAEEGFFCFASGCARFPTGTYGVGSTLNGQCVALRFDRVNGISVAVALNCEEPGLRDLVVNKLMNALLSSDACAMPELLPAPRIDAQLEELAGCYEGARHEELRATLEGGNIHLRRAHSPFMETDTAQDICVFGKGESRLVVRIGGDHRCSVGAFRDPVNQGLCLRIGANVYRKTA